MCNAGENMWTFLTAREAEYCRSILSEFEGNDKFGRLTATIRREDITAETMPFLFELRFAKALNDRGLNVDYEFTTVGNTTVDFRVTAENNMELLIELVSINASAAVQQATQHEAAEDGIQWQALILSSDNQDPRFSEEGEVLLVQQKICEKAFRDSTPIKFPPPNQNGRLNVLVVDMRGFLGGFGGDNADCVQLCYGNGAVGEFQRRFWTSNGQRRPIAGLFEATNPLRGAQTVRERIHAILFTRDKSYIDGGLMSRDNSFLIRNPQLISEQDWVEMRNAIRGVE